MYVCMYACGALIFVDANGDARYLPNVSLLFSLIVENVRLEKSYKTCLFYFIFSLNSVAHCVSSCVVMLNL